MTVLIIPIEVSDWKVVPNKDLKKIAELPPWNYTMFVEKGKIRNNEQNAMLWAILNQIALDTGNDVEELHEFFKNKFLSKTVEYEKLWEQKVVWSTTRLTTKQFSEYIEKIILFCNENWIVY